jgi:hypothetical protein
MKRPKFFVGLHHPNHAASFDRCMISVNRLERRKSDFQVGEWILDSGAFTRITTGLGHMPVGQYTDQIQRWKRCGSLVAAVSQDWMCEPFVREITGLSIEAHQGLTIDRFDELTGCGVYIMPVLQGYAPQEYASHLEMYGDRLRDGAWVGVGSICRRNGSPREVEAVLRAISQVRPDLRLHGFGLKKLALRSDIVTRLLWSCDSMAWSYAARREGRNANSVSEAVRYVKQIAAQPIQFSLDL